jgi:hypothetical protein
MDSAVSSQQKSANTMAAKAAAAAEAQANRTAGRVAKAEADQERVARDARAARIKCANLTERFLAKDHMLDTPPKPMDMENASRDALAALHLNQYNTGLGNNRALHDLHYCELTGNERVEQIKKAEIELAAEAKETAAEQIKIGETYRQAINAERIIYACACCGLLNFSTTGEFRRMSLERLEPLRYTGSAADTERWARITHAHAHTEAESGKRYDCVFNYYPPMAPHAESVALPPMGEHYHLIPDFVDVELITGAQVCGVCARALIPDFVDVELITGAVSAQVFFIIRNQSHFLFRESPAGHLAGRRRRPRRTRRRTGPRCALHFFIVFWGVGKLVITTDSQHEARCRVSVDNHQCACFATPHTGRCWPTTHTIILLPRPLPFHRTRADFAIPAYCPK